MRSTVVKLAALAAGTILGVGQDLAADLSEICIDWATYNPVSLLLKKQGLLEKEFQKDGIAISWVQSPDLTWLEFLNPARSVSDRRRARLH